MKFLHVGDLHLGYRQYGMQTRADDVIKVHDAIVDHVVSAGSEYAAVVYAGDMFEKPVRSSQLELYMAVCVNKMKQAGVRVLAIPGNHDFSAGNCTISLCGMESLDGHSIEVEGYHFYGIGYCSTQDLGAKLAEVPEGTHVLVMHQSLLEVCAIAPDISAADLCDILKPKGVKYVALGHIHNKWISEVSGIKLAYPGSIEMTDVDEVPEKCVLAVDISKRAVKITEIPLKTRPFERKIITTDEDVEALLGGGIAAKKGGLIVAAVARTLSKRIPALEKCAEKEGVLFHVNKLFDPANPDSISIRSFERARMAAGLKDVIALTRFKEGTPQYALLLQLLERPESVAVVCDQFYKQWVKNGQTAIT